MESRIISKLENVNSFNKPAGPIVLRVTQDIAIIMFKSIFYALVIQWNPFNAVTMGQKIWPKNGWPYYISVQAQRVIMTNAPYNAFEFC